MLLARKRLDVFRVLVSLAMASALFLSSTAQSAEKTYTLEFDQSMFFNVLLRLHERFPVRLCFEQQACTESDFEPAGACRARLLEAQKTRSLDELEKIRLKQITSVLEHGNPPELLIQTGSGYLITGKFSGNTLEELLTSLTDGSPYTWFEANGTYVILPREGSRLKFAVSIDILEGTKVQEAARIILSRDPVAPTLDTDVVCATSSEGFQEPRSTRDRPMPALSIQEVTAVEALCRVVEAMDIDYYWIVMTGGAPDRGWPPGLTGYVDKVKVLEEFASGSTN